MKTAYLITITQADRVIFRFVAATGDKGRASFLAGECIDRLADYHGLTFDYSVEPLPLASIASIGRLAEIEIVREALKSTV